MCTACTTSHLSKSVLLPDVHAEHMVDQSFFELCTMHLTLWCSCTLCLCTMLALCKQSLLFEAAPATLTAKQVDSCTGTSEPALWANCGCHSVIGSFAIVGMQAGLLSFEYGHPLLCSCNFGIPFLWSHSFPQQCGEASRGSC